MSNKVSISFDNDFIVLRNCLSIDTKSQRLSKSRGNLIQRLTYCPNVEIDLQKLSE